MDNTNNSNTDANTTAGHMDPLAGAGAGDASSPTSGWDPNAGQSGGFDPLAGAGIVAGAAGKLSSIILRLLRISLQVYMRN